MRKEISHLGKSEFLADDRVVEHFVEDSTLATFRIVHAPLFALLDDFVLPLVGSIDGRVECALVLRVDCAACYR